MKKICFAAMLIAMFLACASSLAEEIIIDNTGAERIEFSFDEGAKLLEIYFPKVFGCDAAFVRYGEYTMLIDCAGIQYREVQKMLDELGVTELTYALNSHPDEDHIGGFNYVLKNIPAKEFLLGFPEDYDSGDIERFQVYEDLHEMGIPFRRVHHGETIEFGDVEISVLQQTDEHLPRVNNKSVMLMIRYGDRNIYFTGDIQRDTQRLLADDAESLDLKADILKFPHHGYANMQEQFLDMVDPDFVICTGGKLDTTGIEQLRRRKIPFLLTARGVTRLATDGNIWLIER